MTSVVVVYIGLKCRIEISRNNNSKFYEQRNVIYTNSYLIMAYFIPANEMSTASPQNGMQKHQWHITGMQKTPNNSMISQILP